MTFGLTTGPAHAAGAGAASAQLVAGAQQRPRLGGAAAIRPMEAAPETTPPVRQLCRDCLAPDDAICWEVPSGLCEIQVTIGWIAQSDVTVHFATIDESARAGIDYVPVKDGLVTVPAGSQRGSGVVELIPVRPGTADRSFLIELFGPSKGTIEQDRAVVTIDAGQPEKTPPTKG
jgi:hypothetical protein